MYVAEKITCPHCAGSRTVQIQEREFAICGVCSGRGYIQKYQKLTAAQIFGMIWQEDTNTDVKYAVNSGEGGSSQDRNDDRKGVIKKS
ncbi:MULTISPECIES: hypothetical protein [Xanthocytophaga]|uniref:Uncharacterized protein n=2 Tax=Xanthocytophaga TaxID=3078918 RepID=A0AAE3U856_9BACT|nr:MULTISPECIES: hypothetical protein [Xanthocytophaga]MDJ1472464.1 hypothetical protein [Xanthocytophaga flavus]MDJ1483659.1 hypothetical protein [Xanthocytophaga flavus]MDJ1499376.1 hypothetical protein [Xanthocytophaga agilis]